MLGYNFGVAKEQGCNRMVARFKSVRRRFRHEVVSRLHAVSKEES